MTRLLTAAATAAVLVGLAAPQLATAQTAAKAKTQAAAAAATGKATTDAPAASSAQGTAWAVKQGAAPATGAVVSTPAPASAIPAGPQVMATGDLIDTIKASGQFTTLLKAVDATNLTAVLKNNKGLTLFAPTDTAFAAMPPAELAALMANKVALQKLMTHHIINATVDSSKIKGAKGPVSTVAGDKVELDGSGDVLKADNANIVQADVRTTNGVLHVVDHVLIAGSVPTEAAAAAAPAEAAATTTTTTTTAPPAPASKPKGV